jgi:hypothetical protein
MSTKHRGRLMRVGGVVTPNPEKGLSKAEKAVRRELLTSERPIATAAKLLGMSGEREAGLLAEIERLQAALAEAREANNQLAAAIRHAIDHPDDGLSWLREWNYGDPEAAAELSAALARTGGET